MNKLFAVLLLFGLAACSNIVSPEEPAPPYDPIPPLDLASCLFVNVLSPKTVPEGKGFTAEVRLSNFCVSNVTVPIMTVVTSDGKDVDDSGLPLYMMITDPSENDNGAYPLRWSSRKENPGRIIKTEMLELVPHHVFGKKVTWDGRDDNGQVLKKGTYTVFGGYSYAPYGPRDMRFVDIWSIKPFKITKR